MIHEAGLQSEKALARSLLQNHTLDLLLLLAGEQGSTGCVLKDLPDAFVGLGRAFEIFYSTNLLADFLSLDRVLC